MTNPIKHQLLNILQDKVKVRGLARELGDKNHTQLGSKLFHALRRHIQSDPQLLRRVVRSLTVKR